jgi:hypothetical protein
MKRTLFSSISALSVQPFVFAAWFLLPVLASGESLSSREIAQTLAYVIIFAAAHLTLLGIPTFFVLRRVGLIQLLPVAVAGSLIGASVLAILGFPGWSSGAHSSGGNWHGTYREFIVEGQTTVFGWLQYMESLVLFGVHGAAGSLAFLWSWRRHAA